MKSKPVFPKVKGLTPEEMEKVLPKECYALMPTSGELILITRGEPGYNPVKDRLTGCPILGNEAKGLMLKFNEYLYGIKDWRVVQAMVTGSMFGWSIPGANPEAYRNITETPSEYSVEAA